MIQEALTGQPATVSTAPAATVPASVAATAAAATGTKSILAQLQESFPSFIANIKQITAKLDTVSDASKQGFWSGIKSAFNIDSQTAQAFSDLKTQAPTIASRVKELINSADPTTQATVKGLISQVTQLPQFQKLVEYIKSMPFTGGLTEALNTLTQISSEPAPAH